MSVLKIDYNTYKANKADKAIEADKADKADKAIEAFTKYMEARELTKEAIKKNQNAIDKSKEALTIYNKNKDDPESKAYLDEMFKNIRLASKALEEAITEETKTKIYSDTMITEAMV